MTAVANTSKKPSTHRCTTHQRQYSTIESACARPTSARRRRTGRCRPSTGTAARRSTCDVVAGARSAGHSARPTSVSQSSRPTNRKICQKRPMSAYSQPWWPNQKLYVEPELLHHREPLAGERADHDDEQADEQEVDAEPLELRLMARDRRRDVQARAEPGGGDPEHGELRVPGAASASRAGSSASGKP